MGLGMEPRGYEGEMRERRVWLHMPRTDTRLSDVHVHTGHMSL